MNRKKIWKTIKRRTSVINIIQFDLAEAQRLYIDKYALQIEDYLPGKS